jgi:hypothetical protein
MRRGFIYSVHNPPFSYPETEHTREFEELVKEAGSQITLDDRERFIFEMGYQFGVIDGRD